MYNYLILILSNIFFLSGKKVAPRDVAQNIVQNLPPHFLIDKTDIAGPGFINIYLNKEYGRQALSTIFEKGVQPPDIEKRLRVVVDFSSPNIAKEMHVGHLR